MKFSVFLVKIFHFSTPKKIGILAATIIVVAILVWPTYIDFGQKINQIRVDKLGETSLLSIETGGYGWSGSRASYIVGHLIPFNSWAGPPGRAYYSRNHHVYVVKSGNLSKVLSDNHDGGVEMISYKNRLYRIIRLTPSLDEVPKVEVWVDDKFSIHPSNLKWSEWMNFDTKQIKRESPDSDGVISIRSGEGIIKISEIRNSSRVESQFQNHNQVVFQAKEPGIISSEEFWQMFTRNGVLK